MLSRVIRSNVGVRAVSARFMNRAIVREFTSSAIPVTQPVPDNWEKVLFPSRSVGCDADLNWSLCLQQVAPQYNAHRNLEADALVARGAAGKGAVQTSTDESQGVVGYVYFDPTAPSTLSQAVEKLSDPRYSTIPSVRYKKLSTKVFEGLGQTRELFVHDFAAYTFNMRVITDNATTALFLRNLTGSGEASDAMEFASDASVVYHNSRIDAISEGIKLGQKEFSVVDPIYNTVLVGGTASNSAILNSIVYLISNNCALVRGYDESQVVAVQGNPLSTATGSTLVLGAHSATQMLDTLSAAHVTVLNGGRVFPAFAGKSLERVSPKHDRVTPAEPVSEAKELPKLVNVVLVVSDSSNAIPPLSQLNEAQTMHHYFYGASSSPLVPCFSTVPINAHSQATAFTAAVTKAGASVYLLNKSSLGEMGIKQAVKAIAQGAKGTFATSSVIADLKVASAFGDVDATLLEHNTTREKVQATAQQRADALMSFHLALQDSVTAGAIKSN